jgi:hypothetical protein
MAGVGRAGVGDRNAEAYDALDPLIPSGLVTPSWFADRQML